ncbi:hypothetical protein JW926_15395 [Candidatus Sumerlaeota bacterium]|nr:hypothetical protein [Candidatus Sumerlaeota bacterium]
MADNLNEKQGLDDCTDVQAVVSAFENFHNSLELSEDDLSILSSKTQESFEDVKFDLLPSFEDKEVFDDISGESDIIKSTDDPLTLPFTLSEEDEINFDQNPEIVNPILFRILPDESLWLLDHHEETLFRFYHYKGKELIHSFTIPRGTEKFCIGYPGGILIDEENNIYALDVEQQTVHKFSGEGEYDTNFHDQLSRQNVLGNSRDFDIIENERLLLISDFVRGSVRKISLDGRDNGELRFREETSGFSLECVTGVASGKNNRFYVIDPIQKVIVDFDLEGNLGDVLPMEPRSQMEMPFCSQLQMDKNGYLFLVDYETQEIHAYNALGQLKGVFCTGPRSILPDIRLGFFDVPREGRLYFLNRLTRHIHCLQYHFPE